MSNKNRQKEFDISRYTFKDKGLFLCALTHSSYTNEAQKKKELGSKADNERLEFLGDAVFELIVSCYIYETYPELPEGEMTKLRASVVCEASLSEAARRLGLGGLIRMGRGQENSGGRERDSILADSLEAVAGAVFLDGGFECARAFILGCLGPCIAEKRESFMMSDYKTRLQEEIQSFSKEPLEYAVVREEGPAHDRTFMVELSHRGTVLSSGTGKSKKEAEQSCARQALARYLKQADEA